MISTLFSLALLAQKPERALLTPVQDTFLDRATPDANFGREGVLHAGNGKVILIKFPELDYLNLEGKQITSAKIVLSPVRSTPAEISSVSRVRKAWNEGPGRQVRHDLRDPGKAPEPWGFATWNHANVGGEKWANGGASAPQDTDKISTATLAKTADYWEISGVEEAVKLMASQPMNNHGFRLEFTTDASFYSGEWTETRPRLVIETSTLVEDADKPDIEVLSCVPQIPIDKWPSEGEMVTWKVRVRNSGREQATGLEVAWYLPAGDVVTQKVSANVAPGAELDFEAGAPWKNDHSDHRKQILGVQVDASLNEQNPRNGAIKVPMNGLALFFKLDDDDKAILTGESGSYLPQLQRYVMQTNNHVLPGSKFLFAPEGSTERVRLVEEQVQSHLVVDLTELNNQKVEERRWFILKKIARSLTPLTDLFANPAEGTPARDPRETQQLGWLPDTIDDGYRYPGLPIPVAHWAPRIPDQFPRFENGLLSRSEVGILHASLGKLGKARTDALFEIPTGVAVRCFEGIGLPLTQAKVKVYQTQGGMLTGEPILEAETKNSGIFYLQPKEVPGKRSNPFGGIALDGGNSHLILEATKGGETSYSLLPLWKLWDWAFRSNLGVATVELRFMLPDKPLDHTENLAGNKLVTSSQNLTPAELVAMVDGDTSTSLEINGKNWIELDLGRDRSFGEVQITTVGAPIQEFVMSVHKTGQSNAQSLPWMIEIDGAYQGATFGKKEGDLVTTTYRTIATRSRFLRIMLPSDQKVNIAEIKVVPTKIAN